MRFIVEFNKMMSPGMEHWSTLTRLLKSTGADKMLLQA
jgi:hypothetical protein